MSDILIYTDGGARGNPGPAGAVAVAYEGDKKLFELKKFLGARQTNNWAEYEAVILALTEAKKRGLASRAIEMRMDSELLMKQLTGQYKIEQEHLQKLFMQIWNLRLDFPYISSIIFRAKKTKKPTTW